MRTVSPEQVKAMLADAAGRFGLDLDRLRELAHADELAEPELRDLWLIWGSVIDRYYERRAVGA